MRIGHWIPCYLQPTRLIIEQTGLEGVHLTKLGHEYIPRTCHTSGMDRACNNTMWGALAMGLDFLCIQGSDMVAARRVPDEHGREVLQPEPFIHKLLETALETEATMTTCVSALRVTPPRPSVEPLRVEDIQTKDRFQCHRAGTGISLINLHHVRDWGMDGGWFLDVLTDNGRQKKVGQDIYFCRLIEKHGGTIWADARIPNDHDGLYYPGFDALRAAVMPGNGDDQKRKEA